MKRFIFTLLTLLAVLCASAEGREYISLDSRLGHGGGQTWHMMRDGENGPSVTFTSKQIKLQRGQHTTVTFAGQAPARYALQRQLLLPPARRETDRRHPHPPSQPSLPPPLQREHGKAPNP